MGQSQDGCYDPAAPKALAARGAELGTPAQIAQPVMLDVQIDRNLADVVQQGRVGRVCGPGFGLGRLCLRRDARRQQV